MNIYTTHSPECRSHIHKRRTGSNDYSCNCHMRVIEQLQAELNAAIEAKEIAELTSRGHFARAKKFRAEALQLRERLKDLVIKISKCDIHSKEFLVQYDAMWMSANDAAQALTSTPHTEALAEVLKCVGSFCSNIPYNQTVEGYDLVKAYRKYQEGQS